MRHDIRLDRRDFLIRSAAALAAGALPGVAAFAQSAQPLTIITPFGFIADFVELMNGVTGGHFAKHGLNVTVLGGNGTSSAIQQVIAGQAKFTRSSALDVFQAARAQPGQGGPPPLITVSTLYQGSTFHVVSDRTKQPIRRAEEMRGKTIGIVSVGGTTEIFLDLILNSVGIKPAEVRREVVGNNAAAFPLIQQGRIDAFIAAVGVVATLRQQNAPMEVWSTDKYVPMPSQCYSATPEVIRREPEMVVKFLRGLRDSVHELIEGDYVKILERASKQYEIPGMRNVAALKATHEMAVPLWLKQGRGNLLRNVPELWASGANAVNKAGMMKIPDVRAFYTNEFIDMALKV